MEPIRFAVLGAGAWGSTLADLLASNGHHVAIWDQSTRALDTLRSERRPFGVPELSLAETVRIEDDLAAAVARARYIVLVIPSQAIRPCVLTLKTILDKASGRSPILVLASKGLDLQSLEPLSSVVSQLLPDLEVGAVSGPCIAREVARKVPTSVVCAAPTRIIGTRLRDAFGTPSFRTYTQIDLLGVELGGALKNVIAIAAGIGDGLGYGANSKSALLARGLAEMARLATALGADPRTIYGLAGLGDLAVTCFSPHSRNRTFGELLGKGRTAEQAKAEIAMTVEGEMTARAALGIAAAQDVELPISEAVVKVCKAEWTAEEAVTNLMTRELKDEFRTA